MGPMYRDPAFVSRVQCEHIARGRLAGLEQVDEAGIEDLLGKGGAQHRVDV